MKLLEMRPRKTFTCEANPCKVKAVQNALASGCKAGQSDEIVEIYSQKSLEKVLGTLKHEIDWNSNKNIISNNVYHKQINIDSDDSSSIGQGSSPDKVIWWFELIWYDLTRWSRSMWIELDLVQTVKRVRRRAPTLVKPSSNRVKFAQHNARQSAG